MADWKAQVNYNYNPPYAYTYGLVYPSGSEQANGNLAGWNNGGLADLNNYNAGANQGYYATTPRTQETPPQSPEEAAFNGLVYFGDNQANRLVLTGAPQEGQENGSRRAGSETASDVSEHASPSPDSWSSGSGSSHDSSLPHADPATWVNKNLNDATIPEMWEKKDIETEVDNGSPDATLNVSSSLNKESQTFAALGNEIADTTTSSPQASTAEQKNPNTNPKGKVRVAFTESQMDILHTRFSMQRYLTPAEMKQMAEVTGLTYKQVKTWFQNRRMKLRRHQKDKNWVSERYTVHKTGQVGGPVYPNFSPCIQPYPGEARPPMNQHMMDAAFKKPAPNLAFYLAAMGNAQGSAGYSSWSPGTPQAAFPNSSQAPSWPMQPAVAGPYEHPPNAFNPVIINTTGQNTSFNKDQMQINNHNPLCVATEHNIIQ